MLLLGILILALADSTGLPRETGPALAVEHLGSPYCYRGSEKVGELEVEVWLNLTLDRMETWYKPSGAAWLKIDDRTYVLGLHERGEWKTDPSRRLVFRRGAWRELRGCPVAR